MEKTSQTRNFYIFGDDSYTPSQDESYKFYNIDFIGMGYNNTVGVEGSSYYVRYEWGMIPQARLEKACTNPYEPDMIRIVLSRLKGLLSFIWWKPKYSL